MGSVRGWVTTDQRRPTLDGPRELLARKWLAVRAARTGEQGVTVHLALHLDQFSDRNLST
jgi:hypothetical protein